MFETIGNVFLAKEVPFLVANIGYAFLFIRSVYEITEKAESS